MNKDLVAIFEYLEREKGIKREIIVSTIEEALVAAARKSVRGLLNVAVKLHPKTGVIEVTAQKEVVDEVTIPDEEIQLDLAREITPDCQVGDWIEIPVTPQDFGRIAAQTARQVMTQKLREAERDVIYEEYRHRVNEIVSGTVKRIVRSGILIVDLGKVEAILPERFYPRTEKYNVGDRVYALLYQVRDTENGGAEVVLSRSHPQFAVELFKQEVPELNDGTVVIERIARDAGYRTKMAVRSLDSKVDPVGACVGVRGTRVKNVIRELNNEKIDIFPFSEDPLTLLEHALSSAVEIKKIHIDEEEERISIVVDDEQYPTVLGKRGMNARLTGELLGMQLEVRKMSEYQQAISREQAQMALGVDEALDEALKIEGLNPFVVGSLIDAGYTTLRKLLQATPAQLAEIPEISTEMSETILEKARRSWRKREEETEEPTKREEDAQERADTAESENTGE